MLELNALRREAIDRTHATRESMEAGLTVRRVGGLLIAVTEKRLLPVGSPTSWRQGSLGQCARSFVDAGIERLSARARAL